MNIKKCDSCKEDVNLDITADNCTTGSESIAVENNENIIKEYWKWVCTCGQGYKKYKPEDIIIE